MVGVSDPSRQNNLAVDVDKGEAKQQVRGRQLMVKSYPQIWGLEHRILNHNC